MTQIDYAPLDQPVTRADLRAAGVGSSTAHRVTRLIIILAAALWIGYASIQFVRDDTSYGGFVLANGGFVIGFSVAVYVAWIVTAHRTAKRTIRIERFAASNGFNYSAWSDTHELHAGMIFQIGHSQTTLDILQGGRSDDAQTAFEIGNYRYTVGSGKSQHTSRWGYIAMPLKRNLPHMVLDAKGNNSLKVSNLPTAFKGSQVLALEGDFQKHFKLYAPEAYKRDAYYIFTPDIMALLIDHSGDFDVEIVDNMLYVYGKQFALDHKQTLEKLFVIIDRIGAKLNRQTDTYADETVGNRQADIVADQGRRLKQSTQIVAIIIAVAIALLYTAYTIVSGST